MRRGCYHIIIGLMRLVIYIVYKNIIPKSDIYGIRVCFSCTYTFYGVAVVHVYATSDENNLDEII